jgi:excisionase family DNA binding protein
MSQIINLCDAQDNNHLLKCEDTFNTESKRTAPLIKEANAEISTEQTMQFIKNSFPDQILFSIREVAAITKVSYEFIRQSIRKGKINYCGMGERKLIHINELCRIITGGI